MEGIFVEMASVLEDKNEYSLADAWQECLKKLEQSIYRQGKYEIMYRSGN